ncbi:hypothetical protein BDV25DRAFT_36535 [Aspergillus avenaceus]|uniref:BTB domain-containing protein n=1 Tax=Aspergillus avenaceus TaxID=36643 RepID=A0A5N6TLS6_ASPAV|nr:hypothetical protein BDV25DRAFT_36535 [Aspergillus avenaceus]
MREFPQLRLKDNGNTFDPQNGYKSNLKYISTLEIDEDIGHTLVHYLYTGEYETLRDSPPHIPRRTTEYKRSVLAYHAARKYGLEGLEAHAKHFMQVFDRDVTTSEIMRIARGVYGRLPRDERWFLEYVRVKLEDEFEADANVFKREWFVNGFGREAGFDRLVMQIVVEIYSEKLTTVARYGYENRRIVHELANGDEVRIVEERIPEGQTKKNGRDTSIGPAPEENLSEVRAAFNYDDEQALPEIEDFVDRSQTPEPQRQPQPERQHKPQQQQQQQQQPPPPQQDPRNDDWPLPSPTPPLSSSPSSEDPKSVKEKSRSPEPAPEQPKEEDLSRWSALRKKRGKTTKKNKKLKIVEPEPTPSSPEPMEPGRWPDMDKHPLLRDPYSYAPPSPLSPVYEEPTLPLRTGSV